MKPHNKRRNGGYTPVKTVPAKPKRRKNKKHSFESKHRSEAVELEGIKREHTSANQRQLIFAIMIVAGIVLACLDIRDKGMIFEGLGFKYSGSLSGILITIIGGFLAAGAKPKVKLE